MTIAIYANPHAGRGRAKKQLAIITRFLDQHAILYQVCTSHDLSQAQSWLRALSHHDIELLIVIGGDGTLHFVANALQDFAIPLLPIAAGTMNLFAHVLSKRKLQQQLTRVVHHQLDQIKLPLLQIQKEHSTTYAVLCCDFGLGAQLVKMLSDERRATQRKWHIIKSLLRLYFVWQPKPQHMIVDNQVYSDVEYMIVTALPIYAHPWLKLQRSTALNWRAYLWPRVSFWKLIIALRYALFSSLEQAPFIKSISFNVITVSDGSAPVEIDGEFYGNTPITIQLSHQEITCCY